jgi:hypothetical protein
MRSNMKVVQRTLRNMECLGECLVVKKRNDGFVAQ